MELLYGAFLEHIFTTPTGKNTFRIIDNIIYATNWDNVTFH